MVFVATWYSVASVLATTLVFPCTFHDLSSCTDRNGTLKAVDIPSLTTTWHLLTQDKHSVSPRKRSSAEKWAPIGDRNTTVREEATLVTTEETTTPHFIKDYEADYPQIYETVKTSTTRIPKKVQRFPYPYEDPVWAKTVRDIISNPPMRDLKDAMSKILEFSTNGGLVHPKCEQKDEGKMFPDPSWCKRYFHCQNGFINVYVCPEMTVFNPQKNICDHRAAYQCSSSYLDLDIANWRRVMTSFYMKSERPWVRDRMIKKVTPMSEVTTPSEAPYFTVPPGRFYRNILRQTQRSPGRRWYSSLWNESKSRRSGI